MTRATVIRAIRDFLASHYTGPVAIHPETSVEAMAPPYAVIRIGSADQLYPGQAEIWDMNILIGVFHDADSTTAANAESQAGSLFAMFDDPSGLFASSVVSLAWSALERFGTEASIIETRWQHVAAFRAIVSPMPSSGSMVITGALSTPTLGSVVFPTMLEVVGIPYNGRPQYTPSGTMSGATALTWEGDRWDLTFDGSADTWSSFDDVATPNLATTWAAFGDASGVPVVSLAV